MPRIHLSNIKPKTCKKIRAFLKMTQTEFVEFSGNGLTVASINAFERGVAVGREVHLAILLSAEKAQKIDYEKFKYEVLYDYEYEKISASEFAELVAEGETVATEACTTDLDEDGQIDYSATFYTVMDAIHDWKNIYWHSNWGRVTDQNVRAEVIWTAAARKLGALGHPDYQDFISLPYEIDTVDDGIDWQRLQAMDQNHQTIRKMISPPSP